MFEPICRAPFTAEEKALMDAMVVSEQREGSNGNLDLKRTELGNGQLRLFEWGDSMVTLADLVLNRPVRSQCEVMEDLLLVRASIGSVCTYAADGDAGWRFVRPAVTVSFLPRGTTLDAVLEPGTSHMVMTMLIRPAALFERFGLRRGDLPAPLVQAIEGGITQPKDLFAAPIEPRMASLVDDLLHSRLPDSLKGLQVSARRMELLLLIVAAWNEQLTLGGEATLRGRDADLIGAARRILTQRLVDPPTVQELAEELGTNRNKLNELFLRGLGVTPRAFCVQRRIERAQALLREGRLNVAQIAETVGYQHQSSFAAAFRDAVGMCPRDYGNARQRRGQELAAA